MRTARLTWDEVKKIHGDHEIDVYGGEGSRLHGKPELLDKILNGCELMVNKRNLSGNKLAGG